MDVLACGAVARTPTLVERRPVVEARVVGDQPGIGVRLLRNVQTRPNVVPVGALASFAR